MNFCPICSNLLIVKTKVHCQLLQCQTCPYKYEVREEYRSYAKLVKKDLDDLFGGADAWKNVDKTDAQCPNAECGHQQAYFMQVQIRSGDEPMTCFYKCCNCGNRWND